MLAMSCSHYDDYGNGGQRESDSEIHQSSFSTDFLRVIKTHLDRNFLASLSGSPKTVQSASKASFFRQLSILGG